ncbi:MAG: class I tRNA ligase family protein, partial [Rhodosalinus sp.]
DSEFTWENFQGGVNKDLADVLGNFVSRVTKFCRSKFGEAVPEGGDWGDPERQLIADLSEGLARYEAAMEAIAVRRAAQELRALWVLGNEYLQQAAPWAAHKEDPARAAAIVRLALNLIPVYAELSAPFIPGAAETLRAAMKSKAGWPADMEAALRTLPPGHGFEVPEMLFRKITDEERDTWQARFAGGRG